MNTRNASLADLGPDLTKIKTEGLPSSIDSDPIENEKLRKLVASMFTEHDFLRSRCDALYHDWCAHQRVTLDQGCWLLLEGDPDRFPGASALPDDVLVRFNRLKNALELAIGTAFKPAKPNTPTPRFYVADIARVAQAVNMEAIAAAVLFKIATEKSVGNVSTVSPQRQRIDERMNFHRTVINHLLSQQPPNARPIPAKANVSTRRKYSGHTIDVEILGINSAQYCDLFRKLFAEHKQRPGYFEPDQRLIDDCRALNVAFAMGRPKNSKDKVKRRRTGRA